MLPSNEPTEVLNSVRVSAAGSSLHARKSLVDPRWRVIIPCENSSSGEPVREGSRRIVADSNKPVSNRRKLSDNNSVSSNMMDMSDEASDSRISGLRMNMQAKLIVPSKVHVSMQDVLHSGTDVQSSSGSPTMFQSLEAVGSRVCSVSHVHQSAGDHCSHINMQVLHPSINNLSFSGGAGVEIRSGLSVK
jgi:hypothetical protein